MTEKKLFVIISVAVIALFIALFSIFGYSVNQGFNPSDEGVVLSQSWRLLHGEIPHKEFISIRPVASGLIHQIDLILPLPIITSSRIIAAYEYLLLSIIWSYILIQAFCKQLKPEYRSVIYFAVITSTFVLNLNNGPIFTWTTTDALLLAGMGCYFLIQLLKSEKTNSAYFKYAIISLFCISASALCRQSFALPYFVSALIILLYPFSLKKLLFRIGIIFLGSAPLLFYLLYLLQHNALDAFIAQMTGRTELVETGIITYFKSLVKYTWLFILYAGVVIFLMQRINTPVKNVFNKIAPYYTALLLAITLWFTFHLFLGNYSSDYSFYFFWLLTVLFCQSIVLKQHNFEINAVLALTLLLAWTSSISIGDNSPRPFLGGIAVTSLIVLIGQVSNIAFFQKRLSPGITGVFAGSLILITLSQISMPRLNYRDWKSSRLHYSLQDIMPEMGATKVNDLTRKYYVEFDSIYTLLQKPQDQFTMVPNNAFIYAIMHSRNPMPLDWMQHHEYIGVEQQFADQVSSALSNQKIYVFIDKIDSKQFFKGEIPFSPDLEFNHSYIPWLKEQCIRMPIESKYFEIYESRYQNLGH